MRVRIYYLMPQFYGSSAKSKSTLRIQLNSPYTYLKIEVKSTQLRRNYLTARVMVLLEGWSMTLWLDYGLNPCDRAAL